MGGVVSYLVCLYCRSGCRASVVASALAFHPPTPFYKMKQNELTGEYMVLFASEIPDMPFDNLRAYIIETSSGTRIPIMVLTHPKARMTLIYSHGNATDCGAMYPMFVMMAKQLQVNIVGYDYTGYGAVMIDGHKPTEAQVYKDIDRVYDWVLETKLVQDPARELLLYGQSVGGGPTVYLASKRPVAGIVLHSSFKSGLRVVTESRLLGCCDIFPNIRRLPSINCATFVIHGMDDTEISIAHGEALQAAVPAEYRYDPWWVPMRGHNDVLLYNEKEFLKRMKRFLAHVRELVNDDISSHSADSVMSRGDEPDYMAIMMDLEDPVRLREMQMARQTTNQIDLTTNYEQSIQSAEGTDNISEKSLQS